MQTPTSTTAVETSETSRLIGSDKVEGTTVNDRSGIKLGTIERVMIDKHTGKVAYAVMSFGGFLGIGERYHPLPWAMLDFDPRQNAYVVDLDKGKLEGAPTLEREDRRDLADEVYGREVHDYYGVRPFWL